MTICENCEKRECFFKSQIVVSCPQYKAKDKGKVQTKADRMIKMLQENDAYSLLDWWQEIFEDGVPSEDYFKWWLQQPAEGD